MLETPTGRTHMQWSPQQEAALKAVSEWLSTRDRPFYYLAGYAGAGKTTLAIEMAKLANGGAGVCFGSFTGKAALVMRRKGCWGASTIHRMIYEPREDEETGEVKFILKPRDEFYAMRLIIIDEVSM